MHRALSASDIDIDLNHLSESMTMRSYEELNSRGGLQSWQSSGRRTTEASFTVLAIIRLQADDGRVKLCGGYLLLSSDELHHEFAHFIPARKLADLLLDAALMHLRVKLLDRPVSAAELDAWNGANNTT